MNKQEEIYQRIITQSNILGAPKWDELPANDPIKALVEAEAEKENSEEE